MKAIFAVSALAAAISAQAIAADTDATWGFTGEVNVGSEFDLEAETRNHTLTDGDDGWNLDATLTIKNGGFTGSLAIEGSDGDASVSMGDLTYEEGIMLFGDIDSIVTTQTSVDDMAEHTDYGVEKGFRLTFADLGLKVQAEVGSVDINPDGDDDWAEGAADNGDSATAAEEVLTDFGFAAAYERDLGVAVVTADVQYREAPLLEADTALPLYYGVKAVATPVDMLTVTAGYTSGHSAITTTINDGTTDYYVLDADETKSSYGVRADVTVTEAVSAWAYYSQVTESALATQADANIAAGVKAVFGPVTAEASQDVDAEVTKASVMVADDTEVADGVTVSAHAEVEYDSSATDTTSWSAGAAATYAFSEMLTASAGVELDEDGSDATDMGTEFTVNVTYTTEGGAALTADYRNANATFDDDGIEHSVTLKAAYSF